MKSLNHHVSPFYRFTAPDGNAFYMKICMVKALGHVSGINPDGESSGMTEEEEKTVRTIFMTDQGKFACQDPIDDVARRLNHDVRGCLNGAITELQKICNNLGDCDRDDQIKLAELLEHQADNLLEALEAIYGADARVIA